MPFTKGKQIFAKVANVSDLNRMNPKGRAEYDSSHRRYRDFHLIIETAEENTQTTTNDNKQQ